MTRKFRTALVLATACAGAKTAQAAPSSNYAVQGTVNQSCTLPSPSLSPSVKSNGTSTLSVQNASSLTFTVLCNTGASIGVQLKANALRTGDTPAANESVIVNYKATASPWGTNPFVTTSETTTNNATVFTGNAVAQTGPKFANVTVTLSNFTFLAGKTQAVKNANYTSTITVVLSAN